ncbi:MAG TPA: hypothetical protein VF765_31240 [Polyangiaceae bacterium]
MNEPSKLSADDHAAHHRIADGLTVILIFDRENRRPPRVYSPGVSLGPRDWEVARRALVGEALSAEELP